MRGLLRGSLVVILAAVAALTLAAPVNAAGPAIYPLATETQSSGPLSGPDGAMWFSGSHGPKYKGGAGGYVGRLSTDWELEEFPLPQGHYTGRPVVGPGADVWLPSEIEGSGGGEHPGYGVVRMTTSGQMTEFVLSSVPGQIGEIAATGNSLWVTASHFPHAGKPYTSVLDRYAVTPAGLSLQRQIAFREDCYASALAAGKSGIWFAELCKPHDSSNPHWWATIVRIGPHGETARYRLPPQSFVESLAIDSRGAAWFGSFSANGTRNEFGRVAPSGELTRKIVRKGDPFSITVGPEGRLWFPVSLHDRVNRGLNSIGPKGDLGKPICAGPKCGYSPYGLTTGPDGNIWYSATVAHMPNGGGGGAGLMQQQQEAKESGFIGRVAP